MEVEKSDLWKRTWTEKAFNPPPAVGVNEPIRLLEEYSCIVVLNSPAETGDAQENVLHHGKNMLLALEVMQVYPLIDFKQCEHATINNSGITIPWTACDDGFDT